MLPNEGIYGKQCTPWLSLSLPHSQLKNSL